MFNTTTKAVFRVTIIAAVCLVTLFLSLAVVQQVLVPVIVYIWPGLEVTFYDWALFGPYRSRHYVSFNLTSPHGSIVKWDDRCDHGNIFLDPSGPAPGHHGPMILDPRGGLIWTSDQFAVTTNLKVQKYRGRDYLTFWGGHKEKTMGYGSYYLLDDTYKVVHMVDAVGDGIHGDLHEFKITQEGTALMTVYNKTQADLREMGWFRGEDGWIVDNFLQEVDIATGELLFEWRASDHFKAADSFMTNPFGGYTEGMPFDFYHLNSIEKDRDGNYLLSSRHFHTVLTIDGRTGEVLWQLGGRATDLRDLSDGRASDFSWQHHARWLDQEAGLLTLFDNGCAWPHVDAPHSEGRLIHVDLENKTAELKQSFVSLAKARSSSQGSIQYIDIGDGEQHVFVGWGSSAAYSEHLPNGGVLCETHFAAAASFWWERAKSYRAFKYPDWHAIPAEWDPIAVISSDALFVSWNGATEVALWELQGAKLGDPQEQGGWQEVDIAEKDGFETMFSLPTDKSYSHFRVAALDAERTVLRMSNVATRSGAGKTSYVLAAVSAIMCVLVVVGYWQHRRKGWTTSDLRRYAQATIDRSKYTKLW